MRLAKTEKIVFVIIIILIGCVGFIVRGIYYNKNVKTDERDKIALRLGAPTDAKPYSYVNSAGELTGYNIDTYNVIAKKLGFMIQWYKLTEESNIHSMFAYDIVDGVLGMDLRGVEDFGLTMTEPLSNNQRAIFIKDYNTDIKGFEDLANSKVSVYREDSTVKDIEDIEGVRVFRADNIESAFSLMFNGMAEAYIGDRMSSLAYLDHLNYKNKIKLIGTEDCQWLSSITLKEGDKELIAFLNQSLDFAKRTNILEKQEIKWFGEDVNYSSRVFKKVVTVTVIVIIILGLVIGLIYRLNFILRKEIKERTRKISEEKALKEGIIKSLFEGVFFIDTKGKVILENEAAKVIFKEESEVNKNFYNLKARDYFDPNDIERAMKNRERIIKKEVSHMENGEEVFLQYSITPVLSDNDSIQGITLSFRDVSEEKKMMKKITEKDKMESLGRLTAGIAHEIRTPLTSIDLYIKLLPEKIENEQFKNDMMEDIPREIKRLSNMVKNLLDYAKPSPPHKELIAVEDEINFVSRMVKSQIDKKKISLEVEMEKDFSVRFDRQQFNQILINLLINASDALEQTAMPRISIKCEAGKDYKLVKVWDNGAGISKSAAKHIFEPFFSTKSGSYGLGLSIVSQLVKENNGEIYVDTEPGEGTRFVIKIPNQ